MYFQLEKPVMRLLLMFFVCLSLQGCEDTDYYFTVKNKKEVTGILLYSDDRVTVFFTVYNGLISRLSVSSKIEDVKVELIKYNHYLVVDEKNNIPSIIGGQGLGEIEFNQNRSATITSKLVFKENPGSLVESIDINILIGGNLISITKDIPLKKGSFSRFDALMNM